MTFRELAQELAVTELDEQQLELLPDLECVVEVGEDLHRMVESGSVVYDHGRCADVVRIRLRGVGTGGGA